MHQRPDIQVVINQFESGPQTHMYCRIIIARFFSGTRRNNPPNKIFFQWFGMVASEIERPRIVGFRTSEATPEYHGSWMHMFTITYSTCLFNHVNKWMLHCMTFLGSFLGSFIFVLLLFIFLRFIINEPESTFLFHVIFHPMIIYLHLIFFCRYGVRSENIY